MPVSLVIRGSWPRKSEPPPDPPGRIATHPNTKLVEASERDPKSRFAKREHRLDQSRERPITVDSSAQLFHLDV